MIHIYNSCIKLFPGYGVRYIAAQGPTDQTIQDFWHCVYQENIRLVIMVTGLVEVGRRKCHQYWPNQVGVPEQFGSFILELISEQSQARRLFCHLFTEYSPVFRRFFWSLIG